MGDAHTLDEVSKVLVRRARRALARGALPRSPLSLPLARFLDAAPFLFRCKASDRFAQEKSTFLTHNASKEKRKSNI
jgi:hypothetical protein